jgi:pilus assembly protein Flp/PilA
MLVSGPLGDLSARLGKFLDDENGATMVEYGLLVALIAVGAIAAFSALGGSVITLFGSPGADTLESAASTASGS